MDFGFKKAERLCSKKIIEALFAGGNKSMSAYPIRAVFMPLEADALPSGAPLPKAQVLISVSKRHFKHAVDRNRVKRQLREAYRLNKHLLLDTLNEEQHLAIAFIWLSDEHAKSDLIHSKMQKLLLRIGEEQ